MHPSLKYERSLATFDVRELTYFLYGGKDKTEKREFIYSLIESNDEFRTDDRFYLDQASLYEESIRKDVRGIQLRKSLNLTESEEEDFISALNQVLPISGLHRAMFIPIIESQGTEEQRNYWLPLAKNYSIIGTYAQTELGHGSFIRGLETTATFSVKDKNWIIHSPTLTSIKWWPGNLGKTATHAVIMAQLITHGKNHGIHPFIVQLRSLKDHTSLPNITLGDIGPKMGYNTIDNGYLRFNNLKVPLNAMLMRYAKVDTNGNYTRPPHAKLSYLTMVKVRSGLVYSSGFYLSVAACIATRYSVVRTQGFLPNQENNEENQIINYKLQLQRLTTQIANAYSFWITGKAQIDLFSTLNTQIEEGDLNLLSEVHATVSGLKAFATWSCSDGIEICRKSCGGNGYLRASGLPDLYARTVPMCTFEGDNYVLIQQTARYLLKKLNEHQLHPLASFPSSMDYLQELNSFHTQQCPIINDILQWLDPIFHIELFKHRAIRLLVDLSTELNCYVNEGNSDAEAWNLAQPSFIRVTRAHCYLMIIRTLFTSIESITDRNIREIMEKIYNYFVLNHIEETLTDFLEDGFLNGVHCKQIRNILKDLLHSIRPNMIPLVDAFNISDSKMWHSCLGRYDGQVYKALYESTKNDIRNKSDVLPSYDKYLKELLKGKQSSSL